MTNVMCLLKWYWNERMDLVDVGVDEDADLVGGGGAGEAVEAAVDGVVADVVGLELGGELGDGQVGPGGQQDRGDARDRVDGELHEDLLDALPEELLPLLLRRLWCDGLGILWCLLRCLLRNGGGKNGSDNRRSGCLGDGHHVGAQFLQDGLCLSTVIIVFFVVEEMPTESAIGLGAQRRPCRSCGDAHPDGHDVRVVVDDGKWHAVQTERREDAGDVLLLRRGRHCVKGLLDDVGRVLFFEWSRRLLGLFLFVTGIRIRLEFRRVRVRVRVRVACLCCFDGGGCLGCSSRDRYMVAPEAREAHTRRLGFGGGGREKRRKRWGWGGGQGRRRVPPQGGGGPRRTTCSSSSVNWRGSGTCF